MPVTSYNHLKQKIHQVLEIPGTRFSAPWFFDITLATIILLNVVAIMVESVEGLREEYYMQLKVFEKASVFFFTAEYVLRLWSCNINKAYHGVVKGRLKYIFSVYSLIDLMAIVPFYFSFIAINTQFVRVLWLLRLFRLFKSAPYMRALALIGTVLRKRKEQLILSYLFLIILLIIVSCIMFIIENPHQPQAFSSIPKTMWWTISTLTTVGYGDMVPLSAAGQVFGGIISIIGIAFFALPAGILASGFSQELRRQYQNERVHCPHCGHSFHTDPHQK